MPDAIQIRKLNEVFVRIGCSASVAQEISDRFEFFVPGYMFMPSFRNKFWDGKIRLFNQRDHTLYAGLVPHLQEFAENRDIEMTFVDDPTYGRIDETDQVKREDVESFLARMNLHAHGIPITPHGHQIESMVHALTHFRALLLSPTASGKSLIIYAMVRWFLDSCSGEKVLIVVPTTSLVEQMFTDFEDYASRDPSFNVKAECHRIYSGKERIDIPQRVIISTWQSIYKLSPTWFAPYGMVVGDEAHTFKAKCLTAIMEKSVNAEYRIGTTGTLDGTQTHRLVLEGLFGPVYTVTTTRTLIDQDQLSDLSIDVILLKYPEDERRAAKLFDYDDEMDFLVKYYPRNRFIRNLAIDQKGNTLVLFNFVEKHGKPLRDLIEKKLVETDALRKLFFVSGEVPAEERENIRAITEKEADAIIVASMGTFSQGINIRNLHNIIFASPSKSQIRVLQSIGRGLRKADNGQMTRVYDIADDLQFKKSRNYTLEHAGQRIKIYAKEKFAYKIHEVPIA